MEEQIKNRVHNKVIMLEWPFEVVDDKGEKKTIDRVILSRLKSKHLEVIPASLMKGKGKSVDPKEVLPLVAALCDLTKDQAGEIDFEDLVKIVEALEDFLADATSLKTGKK